jgi:hypothetical protein
VILVYVADAVWILALSAMWGAARGAARQIPKDVRVPLKWNLKGEPTFRARRDAALATVPVLALVVGLVLLFAARAAVDRSGDRQLVVFGLRVFIASLLALLHMLWLRRALVTLHGEGKLEP